MFFLLICSSSIDICELSLEARMQGSMRLVMLSSDNFLGAAPVETHHMGFRIYFFELYYTHMSLENTLGVFGVGSKFFLPAVSGAAPHIVS